MNDSSNVQSLGTLLSLSQSLWIVSTMKWGVTGPKVNLFCEWFLKCPGFRFHRPICFVNDSSNVQSLGSTCVHEFTVKLVLVLHGFEYMVVWLCLVYFKGSRPEWYILTTPHAWDMVFWCGTLDLSVAQNPCVHVWAAWKFWASAMLHSNMTVWVDKTWICHI